MKTALLCLVVGCTLAASSYYQFGLDRIDIGITLTKISALLLGFGSGWMMRTIAISYEAKLRRFRSRVEAEGRPGVEE
jgi:hypothetical protein